MKKQTPVCQSPSDSRMGWEGRLPSQAGPSLLPFYSALQMFIRRAPTGLASVSGEIGGGTGGHAKERREPQEGADSVSAPSVLSKQGRLASVLGVDRKDPKCWQSVLQGRERVPVLPWGFQLRARSCYYFYYWRAKVYGLIFLQYRDDLLEVAIKVILLIVKLQKIAKKVKNHP